MSEKKYFSEVFRFKWFSFFFFFVVFSFSPTSFSDKYFIYYVIISFVIWNVYEFVFVGDFFSGFIIELFARTLIGFVVLWIVSKDFIVNTLSVYSELVLMGAGFFVIAWVFKPALIYFRQEYFNLKKNIKVKKKDA